MSQSIWRCSIAWSVTLFMGIQSLVFYSLVAWFPTMIMAKGMKGSFAGNMALAFQLGGIHTVLSIAIQSDRFKNQKGLELITSLFYLIDIILFIFSQTESLVLISVILMVLGMDGSINLSIAFISLRSPNSKRTSELLGMSQSAGYLLAAIGPVLMGIIYDAYKSWALPIIIFGGLIILLGLSGWFAGRVVGTQE